jgi:hypothetical protein
VVRVSIEVRSGAARFRVGVQASSIQRAVNVVKGLYSASDVRVIFPIDPEGFFIEDPFAKEGIVRRGIPQEEKQLVASEKTARHHCITRMARRRTKEGDRARGPLLRHRPLQPEV